MEAQVVGNRESPRGVLSRSLACWAGTARAAAFPTCAGGQGTAAVETARDRFTC